MTCLDPTQAVEGFVERLQTSDGQREELNHGRQGKRSAFGATYVVGWIGQFINLVNPHCWRSRRFAQGIQCPERRRIATCRGFFR